MDMAERTILITGCSSGIGRASARMMQARGWRVFATARTSADLSALTAEGFDALALDYADPASIATCAAAALDRTGGAIDALFNNGAYGQPGAVEDLPPDALRRQIEVNLIGPHTLTRALLPAMRARRSGRIVNCSSVLGFVAAPYRGAYCASKFALEALTDTLRLELAGSGIGVVLIEPGPIRTRFVEHALAAAKAVIDIEGSVHKARYEALIAGLARGGKETFKLEPEAVASYLVHAVESARPRLRYRVTVPTHAAAVLKRLLPGRAMDWFAARG
jgi:NAD(P)-dependent dehydrogenase (short-subunit alcohol dehydrogenase family)